MKIRTKLVLLLSVSLVVTMVVASWLRIRWTRQALERNVREQATETMADIASDLQRTIREDSDDDDISERLKFEIRRHRSAANIELSLENDGDDESSVKFHLDFTEEEPQIKHTPRAQQKPRSPTARRDDGRRALYDHGDSLRAPGDRSADPLWRMPERSDSSRWALLATRPPAHHLPRAIVVDLRSDAERQSGAHRYLDLSAPVELEGPRRGQLTARFSLEPIDRLIRTEEFVSAAVTGAAVLLLMVLTALIVQRVVARPVAALESAMRSVEGGDLSQRVAEGGADEIGALSNGFNSMIERLSQANEEIRAFNRRLADEVSAATIDLARKNEALAQLNRLLHETRRELGDKERLAALGQLAAQLAHEIGTPLGSVSGHLQLALSARDVPPSLKDRLGVATRELERVSKIVRDYLDSTRPVKPARLRCDLGRLVEEAIGIALGAVERPGLMIERTIDPTAAEINSDPGLLRQILVNLLANAIDAVSGRGQIRVAVEAPASQAASDMVVVSIRDDGVGISADDVARIFEPFYTTKGRGKGTGLGLAICRELAHALGGRITVESAPGVGSTFRVQLPREPISSPIAGMTERRAAGGRG